MELEPRAIKRLATSPYPVIQLDGTAYPGNSGSPLYDPDSGEVIGIINAFRGMKNAEQAGIAAVAGGISEALVTTAVGLFVAIPAVMMYNYLSGRVEAFDVEMDNSSSELVDYFLKRRNAVRR